MTKRKQQSGYTRLVVLEDVISVYIVKWFRTLCNKIRVGFQVFQKYVKKIFSSVIFVMTTLKVLKFK